MQPVASLLVAPTCLPRRPVWRADSGDAMLQGLSHDTFDPTHSDPWEEVELLNDILHLAGVKDLKRGRRKLLRAISGWDTLVSRDLPSKDLGNIITKGREFYRALQKLQAMRGKNAEGDDGLLDYLDTLIFREAVKRNGMVYEVRDVLRSTDILIKAFKNAKKRFGFPHEKGQRRSRYYFACELVGHLESAVLPVGGHFTLDVAKQAGTICTAMDMLRAAAADPDSDRTLHPPGKHPVHSYKRYLQIARQLHERPRA